MKATFEFDAPESCSECQMVRHIGRSHPSFCLVGYMRIDARSSCIARHPDCPLKIEDRKSRKSRKSRKRIYISGKITGDPDYKDKFAACARDLEKAGYAVANPAVITDESWDRAMRKALKMMLDCDGVALLPDWMDSRGARIEKELADNLGIPALNINRWLDDAEAARREGTHEKEPGEVA